MDTAPRTIRSLLRDECLVIHFETSEDRDEAWEYLWKHVYKEVPEHYEKRRGNVKEGIYYKRRGVGTWGVLDR